MNDHSPKDSELIKQMAASAQASKLSRSLFDEMCRHRYCYNFSWLGRPIIQFPQDIVAMQEIFWSVRPDLIIETGVAHGGSLILSASLLQMMGGEGKIIGIDIDIRAHNRAAIEAHPLASYIELIQGSSINETTVEQVLIKAREYKKILVILDSNHTHAHVAKELSLYSPLVKNGSYLIVFDTVIQDMASDALVEDRPWSIGNNPKTAVWEFLKSNSRFEIDQEIQDKLLLTAAPDGYLKCIKD